MILMDILIGYIYIYLKSSFDRSDIHILRDSKDHR